ncbi:Sister chromatid cohesion protein pds5 [Kickxella alabastrina]|nr:Sister chromatid cohesion protein pds5 [Kickxella alabastrina]
MQEQQADGDGQAQRRISGLSSSLDDLRSAHYLILELNKSAPGTLLNVIPQLEEELSVEDVDIRILATGVLGEMFAEKGFTLAKRYESTWKAWKGRRADTLPLVRIQWVEHAVSLYQHQPQLSRELNDYVVEKLCDVDDKVRQAACRSLGLLDVTQVVQAAIGENVVDMLGERCKDRKAAVRSEAIIALANIYSQIYEELEQGNAAAHSKWGSIPSKIFMLRYINDPDIDSKVESILTGAILNFAKIKDDRSRCQRLLVVFNSLTTKARSGFYSYMRRQRDIISLTDAFLDLCEKQDQGTAVDTEGATVGQQLRVLTVKISACFPERAKVENALAQLAALHDSEVYRGLRATMDAENDIKAVRKHQKSALKKLSTLAPNLLDATAPLWKCVGLTTTNRALVPFLIEHASSSANAMGAKSGSHGQLSGAAGVLVGYITDVFPEMLQFSSAELFDVDELRTGTVVATEERLALMVKFAKAIPRSIPHDPELESQLALFVRSGASVRQAKYSAFLVTQIGGAEGLCAALTGDMVDNLDNTHIKRRAPSYAALSRFAQYAPAAFAIYSERISTYLVQSMLMGGQEEIVGDDAMEADDWVARDALGDAALTKIYAVKILTNWLVGIDRQTLTRESVQTVLGALRQLVRNGGEIRQDGSTSALDRQHLLLTAATCMLKLASLVHFDKVLNVSDVLSLSMVVQHPCYEVRSAMLLKKLVPALVARRIHVRFIPALFLVAHDPEAAMRDNVKHAVELHLSQIRPTPGSPSVVEDSFCRMLFTLAHHPDWDDSQMVDTLELFTRYIEFYISCVCAAQNVSLLFCYAGEIKAYKNRLSTDPMNRDTLNDVFTKRLYVLSELAQYLLREKSISSNWPVNVYPGKLSLPADIFEPLSGEDKENAPRSQLFLDAEFIQRRARAPAASRANAAAAKRSRSRSNAAANAKRSKNGAAIVSNAAGGQTIRSESKSKSKSKSKARGKRAAAGSDSDDDEDEDDVNMDNSEDDMAEDVEMSSVAETSDEE